MPQKEYFCFTSRYEKLSGVLINNVTISQAFDPLNKEAPPPHKIYSALWDTGATNTVITKRVVDECELKPISMTKIHTANGVRLSEVYLICVGLPNKIKIPTLKVTEGNIAHIDILIGMDVIGLGDFAVTNKDGKTLFSYRMPSMECIDFVQQKTFEPIRNPNNISRNSPCPCGSGKKYKRCCGK